MGSLFSGYEGLGMAVQQVLGGDIAWVSDIDPGACKILAHRYPHVPNIGDITAVDWAAVEPVGVLTGGFPCQDVSAAGKRLGMRPGTRSGLWSQMAYAISQLRPGLVVVENVRGLLSANAHSDLEPCPWCLGDDEPVALRALGGVLGDLAGLGYDASWQGLRASDVGAPHGRFRVFVVAWPAADTDGIGGNRPWLHGSGERRGAQPADRGVAAPDTSGNRRHERRPEPARLIGRPHAVECGAPAAAHTHDAANDGQRTCSQPGAGGAAAARAERETRVHGHDANRLGVAARGVDWGAYEPAVRRWERLTRPAPAPTEPGKTGQPRLSPAFVEWLMGLPAGWVTEVPGLTRNEQLKALGNGVVPQQAAEALRLLLPDARAAA